MLKLFLVTFLIVVAIVAMSLVLLSVRLFFGRSFVKTHVSQSKAMRQRGIGCVQSQDAEARMINSKQVNERQ